MLKKSYTSNTRLVLKPQMDSCKKKTEQDFSSDLNSSHLWNNFSIFNFQTLQWIQLILAYPYITAVYIWYTACVSVILAWTLLSCKSKWSGKNYIIGVNRSECTSYGMGCVKLKPVRSHYEVVRNKRSNAQFMVVWAVLKWVSYKWQVLQREEIAVMPGALAHPSSIRQSSDGCFLQWLLNKSSFLSLLSLILPLWAHT